MLHYGRRIFSFLKQQDLNLHFFGKHDGCKQTYNVQKQCARMSCDMLLLAIYCRFKKDDFLDVHKKESVADTRLITH